ncbi:VWA domain-containing protein [Occallatibacter riparius]|uniref:VWA domain-containing protein n=1 Tax=Occallatibacter riparius TaxID=1002689 RepID=A0A9J7BTN8_9BACT|nr:VWA domain-containing protein [Occallatibacter riparius]UWZ84278.1 VWA domain-containing protein [Occallatibacter riparius]
MKFEIKAAALSAFLGVSLIPAGVSQQQQQPAPASVPDAPAPQAPVPLTDAAAGPIRPGGGAGTESTSMTSGTDSEGNIQQQPTAPTQPAAQQEPQGPPPKISEGADAAKDYGQIIRIYSNFVQVPVTVKDPKGKLVAGLTWRDFKVYENNNFMPLRFFSVSAFPLSIAYVVDQSLPRDQMAQVNQSLGAVQGGLTPFDEISVFSYANGPHNLSNGFTGAQSSRTPFVLEAAKASGTEQLNAVVSGPLAGCPIRVNGNCADPNIQPGRSTGNDTFITLPKEIHTLNDAILAAAKELSTRPKERRRVLYVISDGKEYGSKATYKEVLKYLQTNNIAVYGTLVGDAARFGLGRLSRFHLPFTMYDNLLVKYTLATGGTLDSENGVNNIESSYAALASEARNQYTLGYYSHEPLIDGKYRRIDVRVNRPGLEVSAKTGYWPSGQDQK